MSSFFFTFSLLFLHLFSTTYTYKKGSIRASTASSQCYILIACNRVVVLIHYAHPLAVRDVCPIADYRAPDGGVPHAAAFGSEERRVIRFDFVLVQWYK